MRLQYLGDALDHWKGSLFKRLCNEDLLKDLYVEPMITDQRIWTPEELNTYARLLNLNMDVIIHSDRTFTGNRLDYFKSIQHQRDLFLDPDIGISTGVANRKLIKIREIEILMFKNRDRVLAIYQHTKRGTTMSQRVDEVKEYLFNNISDISLSSYESAQVAMLFISKDKKRIEDINRFFQHILCPAIHYRARIW